MGKNKFFLMQNIFIVPAMQHGCCAKTSIIMTCALFDVLTYAIFYFDRLCLTAKSGKDRYMYSCIRYNVFKLQTDSLALKLLPSCIDHNNIISLLFECLNVHVHFRVKVMNSFP